MITIPTASACLEEAARLPEFQSKGNLLNAKDSFGWLGGQKTLIGWTYTINLKIWTYLQPNRLIADRIDKIHNSRIRRASCCHMKCYIGDKHMLVGSFNLTAPTIEDLCFIVKDAASIKHMRKVFNQHWKALKV